MTVTLNLSPDKEAVLKEVAQAQGISAQQWLQSLVDERLQNSGVKAEPPASKDDRPIWEVFVEAMKDVPREALASLPKDGASQIDHYIYGHPKT